MRRWQVHAAFGLDRLRLDEADVGTPGRGQVRLEMRAWSLNYRDLLMVEGRYDPRLAFPWVPLSDGVGEVVEVGADVTRVAVGDRVCPTFSPSWIGGEPDARAVRETRGGPLPGVAAAALVLGEDELVKVPACLDDAAAATLPCAGVTAWSALEGVKAGDTVLVLGSGGVSVWALQLARLMGARVVATTSSEAKAERLRTLGAEHVVLHTEDERWGRTVRRWSGDGVDRVVEVGGAGTLQQSLDAVRVGGTIAVIGVVAGSEQAVSVLPILMKQVRCQGIFVGSRQGFEALGRAVALHQLAPVVDRVFRFDQLPDALTSLRRGAHVGKLVLVASGTGRAYI